MEIIKECNLRVRNVKEDERETLLDLLCVPGPLKEGDLGEVLHVFYFSCIISFKILSVPCYTNSSHTVLTENQENFVDPMQNYKYQNNSTFILKKS